MTYSTWNSKRGIPIVYCGPAPAVSILTIENYPK